MPVLVDIWFCFGMNPSLELRLTSSVFAFCFPGGWVRGAGVIDFGSMLFFVVCFLGRGGLDCVSLFDAWGSKSLLACCLLLSAGRP